MGCHGVDVLVAYCNGDTDGWYGDWCYRVVMFLVLGWMRIYDTNEVVMIFDGMRYDDVIVMCV